MYRSERPYNPRGVQLLWKPFVRVFQALSVSHYSIFHSNGNWARLLYSVIFSIFHISLMFYTLIKGLHIQLKPGSKFKKSPLMFYVNLVTVGGNFVAHAIAHLEPLLTRKHEEKIYRKLGEINEIFATKLNYVTNFDAIRQKFIRHTLAFYLFSMIMSLVYSFFSIPSGNVDIGVYVFNRALAVVIIRARRCQVALHINMMSIILSDLQVLLRRQQLNYRSNSTNSISNSKNCRESIRYLRDIYSNVWLLRNLLSSCFGWSVIAFLMEFTFDLINSSYWAYIDIKLAESSSMIIRKIIKIHFLCCDFMHPLKVF